MPWDYSDIRPLDKAKCPYCNSATDMQPEDGKDAYRCVRCEIHFVARWLPAPVCMDWAKHDRQPPKREVAP